MKGVNGHIEKDYGYIGTETVIGRKGWGSIDGNPGFISREGWGGISN